MPIAHEDNTQYCNTSLFVSSNEKTQKILTFTFYKRTTSFHEKKKAAYQEQHYPKYRQECILTVYSSVGRYFPMHPEFPAHTQYLLTTLILMYHDCLYMQRTQDETRKGKKRETEKLQ